MPQVQPHPQQIFNYKPKTPKEMKKLFIRDWSIMLGTIGGIMMVVAGLKCKPAFILLGMSLIGIALAAVKFGWEDEA